MKRKKGTSLMIKQLARISAGVALSLASVLAINAPHVFAATTDTWTGTDCPAVNCNWSDANNWSAGVPAAGYDLVFDNNLITGVRAPIDDIAGLSINSITFINNSATAPAPVFINSPLTIVAAVSQAASVTTDTDILGSQSAGSTITLGGDVTVTSTAGLRLGNSAGDTLALNGHTLSFVGGLAGNIVAIQSIISGAGGVVYNAAKTEFSLNGTNTYSGTTHVIANDLPVSESSNSNGFGTSAITVETGGSIGFERTASATVSNAITVNGATNGSPVTSLNFGSLGNNVTLSFPAITLTGSTRFSNGNPQSSNLTINLAGITANGHCIEYLGYGNDVTNGPANGFINGPAGCKVTAAVSTTSGSIAVPKTPATGLAAITAKPVTVIVSATIAAVVMLAIAYRVKPARR
jgi:hypothetical protein